jgi:hypothetical protein
VGLRVWVLCSVTGLPVLPRLLYPWRKDPHPCGSDIGFTPAQLMAQTHTSTFTASSSITLAVPPWGIDLMRVGSETEEHARVLTSCFMPFPSPTFFSFPNEVQLPRQKRGQFLRNSCQIACLFRPSKPSRNSFSPPRAYGSWIFTRGNLIGLFFVMLSRFCHIVAVHLGSPRQTCSQLSSFTSESPRAHKWRRTPIANSLHGRYRAPSRYSPPIICQSLLCPL